ncbi:iron ABC transporter permease [Aquimarina sp. ERC-38]|uniref:FecCD family ABC transporter permease n=1 Tax=Aquimarina sp. ERC-38 TaxID=2949996 RepID=UPI002246EBC4|nr:iron ABC transporter permease [Aquimarina sp. ERC-38]UZO80779.1 iron ABC transporter permease [Aquimarina sp. ERC-38]
MTPNKKHRFYFIILSVTLIFCFILNVSLGSVIIPWSAIGNSFINGPVEKESWRIIILSYRIPKACTAILTGGCLGVSGLVMQTFFRNPLAGPFVLGISSGASLGVAILILGGAFIFTETSFFIPNWQLIIASSLGSMILLTIVLLVSRKVKDTMSILIIGLMFGSMTAAVVGILSYFAPAELLQRYIFWSLGSLGNVSWADLLYYLITSVLGILIILFCIKPLNLLLLGENYAKSTGISIQKIKILVIISTGLLAGGVTAFAGPIAFIGLAIPHLTRLLVKTSDHQISLPTVFLTGSILLLLCDTIAQLPGLPLTLPINAVTAIIGAPVVIWLLVKKRKLLF